MLVNILSSFYLVLWLTYAIWTQSFRSQLSYLFTDIVLPLSAIILIWFFFCARKENREALALTVASIIFSLFLIELILGLTGLGPVTKEEAAQRLGQSWDERSKLDLVKALRSRGMDAYPRISSSVFSKQFLRIGQSTFVPLGGRSRTRTILCNETGAWVEFTSDEHGFRNPPGLDNEIGLTVIGVGDSFLMGLCVPDGYTIFDHIRKRYPKAINLGNAGNGPLSALATIREYSATLNPSFVFWFFYEGNDLADLDWEIETPLKNYLQPGYAVNLIENQAEIDSQIESFVDEKMATSPTIGVPYEYRAPSSLLWSFAKLQKTRRLIARFVRFFIPSTKKEVRDDALLLFSEIMDHAKAQVESIGGQLIFVYLPTYERYTGIDYSEVHNGVLRSIEVKGLRTLDIAKYFESHPNPLDVFPYQLPGHYNELGYSIIAEIIMKELENTD